MNTDKMKSILPVSLILTLAIGAHAMDLSDPDLQRVRGVMLYQGSPYTGEIKESYPDGSPKSRSQWANGQRHGISYAWHANGQLSERRPYNENRKHGQHLGWYSDGTPKFVLNFKRGVYHGRCQEWYSDGSPYLDCNYVEGQELGSQQSWQRDGSINANYVVKDGHRYGLVGSKECISIAE